MIAAICIDDHNGMLFNKRRQSRDKIVLQDLLSEGKLVWIHSFSEKLFQEYTGEHYTDNDFLTKAGAKEICFIENQALKTYEDELDELIIYKWNRKYPADFYLDLDLSAWTLIDTQEFAGNSHEKITKERYQKTEKSKKQEAPNTSKTT